MSAINFVDLSLFRWSEFSVLSVEEQHLGSVASFTPCVFCPQGLHSPSESGRGGLGGVLKIVPPPVAQLGPGVSSCHSLSPEPLPLLPGKCPPVNAD